MPWGIFVSRLESDVDKGTVGFTCLGICSILEFLIRQQRVQVGRLIDPKLFIFVSGDIARKMAP